MILVPVGELGGFERKIDAEHDLAQKRDVSAHGGSHRRDHTGLERELREVPGPAKAVVDPALVVGVRMEVVNDRTSEEVAEVLARLASHELPKALEEGFEAGCSNGAWDDGVALRSKLFLQDIHSRVPTTWTLPSWPVAVSWVASPVPPIESRSSQPKISHGRGATA